MSRWLLYLLIVALPITGYLGASHTNAGVRWFGIVPGAFKRLLIDKDGSLQRMWFARD